MEANHPRPQTQYRSGSSRASAGRSRPCRRGRRDRRLNRGARQGADSSAGRAFVPDSEGVLGLPRFAQWTGRRNAVQARTLFSLANLHGAKSATRDDRISESGAWIKGRKKAKAVKKRSGNWIFTNLDERTSGRPEPEPKRFAPLRESTCSDPPLEEECSDVAELVWRQCCRKRTLSMLGRKIELDNALKEARRRTNAIALPQSWSKLFGDGATTRFTIVCLAIG